MLSLSEQLLLIGLNDEKGTVVSSAAIALPYGLSGAILLELFLLKKIELRQKKIKLINSDKTNNDILDEAVALIKSSSKIRDTKHWVKTFHDKIKKLQHRIAENLVDKKILSRNERSFLWIINYNHYPSSNDKPETTVRDRVKSIVLKRAVASEEDVALIGLIKACGLTNEVFDKAERKKAKKRIAEISENHQVSSVISSIVEEITAAVMIIIMASTVTTLNN